MGLVHIYKKLWNSPTITTWASFLTKSFSVTVIMPLVLSRLNTGDINLWYLFTSVISLQVLLDAGFGSAFVRIIAYGSVGLRDFSLLKLGNNIEKNTRDLDEDFIATTYHLMKRVYRILFWVALVFLLTLGSWALKLPIQESSKSLYGWITWIFFCVTFPIVLWGNIYINLLQGTHNIPLVRRWDTIFNLLNSVSCILLLIIFPNIYILILVNQLWLLAATFRNFLLVKNKYNYLLKTQVNIELLENIKKNTVSSAVKSGFGILMSHGIIQISGFIYAQLASPNELSSYLIGMNLIQAIKNFSQAPFYSKLPILAACMGRGDIAGLKSIARKNMFRVYLIYCFMFFIVACFSEDLLTVINSKIKILDQELWALLGIAFIIDRYGAMHLQIYSTTNHIIWHTLNGITGGLMILFSVMLYPIIGIKAFPVSMIISYLLCYSWYAPYKSYDVLRVKFFDFESKVFLPFLVAIIIYFFTAEFIRI